MKINRIFWTHIWKPKWWLILDPPWLSLVCYLICPFINLVHKLCTPDLIYLPPCFIGSDVIHFLHLYFLNQRPSYGLSISLYLFHSLWPESALLNHQKWWCAEEKESEWVWRKAERAEGGKERCINEGEEKGEVVRANKDVQKRNSTKERLN